MDITGLTLLVILALLVIAGGIAFFIVDYHDNNIKEITDNAVDELKNKGE